MTIQISWWILPFVAWLWLCLWAFDSKQDGAIGTFIVCLIGWAGMAAARWLP